MPQQLNPDMIRYYQERIKHLQQMNNALWRHVQSMETFRQEQSKLPLAAQYSAVFHQTMRKAEQDAKAEMRRLNQTIEDLKRKVERWQVQWNQQR